MLREACGKGAGSILREALREAGSTQQRIDFICGKHAGSSLREANAGSMREAREAPHNPLISNDAGSGKQPVPTGRRVCARPQVWARVISFGEIVNG